MKEQDNAVAAVITVNLCICALIAFAVMVTKSAAPLFGLLCMMSYKHKPCETCKDNPKHKGEE